jgi:Metallo-beta-lactamase superfamily
VGDHDLPAEFAGTHLGDERILIGRVPWRGMRWTSTRVGVRVCRASSPTLRAPAFPSSSAADTAALSSAWWTTNWAPSASRRIPSQGDAVGGRAVLITHHHSDHLSDLATLAITRWTAGAAGPLPVVAPRRAVRSRPAPSARWVAARPQSTSTHDEPSATATDGPARFGSGFGVPLPSTITSTTAALSRIRLGDPPPVPTVSGGTY